MKRHTLTTLRLLLALACSLILTTNALAQGVSTGRLPAPECMGVDLDGSQTIRAYGSGTTKHDAIEQAQKNAVQAVIFKGILDGQKGCDVRPILSEPNAAESYEVFFNEFFGRRGGYREYIEVLDVQRFTDRQKARNERFTTYSVTVRVYRNELKQLLREARILNDDALLHP